MDHLAILSKDRKLLSKILSGEKTVESRWYKFRRTPYRNISAGDSIFFKESGCPVTAKAKVSRALFFDNLNLAKIVEILTKYGDAICVPVSYAERHVGKNFCTLVWLEDARSIEPFDVDKKGFGMMSAWITVEDIGSIRK